MGWFKQGIYISKYINTLRPVLFIQSTRDVNGRQIYGVSPTTHVYLFLKNANTCFNNLIGSGFCLILA